MKYIQMIGAFLLLALTQCSPSNKLGNSNSSSSIAQLINAKDYTFLAQYAQPLGGRQIPLTTDYTLTVKNDSLISYLPFFGQSYVAPLSPGDAGIEFTSTNFEYTAIQNKRGGFNIVIKPKEQSKANQMILDVTSSGYASLQVLSANRQAIAFKGIIQQQRR